MSAFKPLTRQSTGRVRHFAYVVDTCTGRIVEACGHKHRLLRTAQECAERMVTRVTPHDGGA